MNDVYIILQNGQKHECISLIYKIDKGQGCRVAQLVTGI